jgi:hypothetical protein
MSKDPDGEGTGVVDLVSAVLDGRLAKADAEGIIRSAAGSVDWSRRWAEVVHLQSMIDEAPSVDGVLALTDLADAAAEPLTGLVRGHVLGSGALRLLELKVPEQALPLLERAVDLVADDELTQLEARRFRLRALVLLDRREEFFRECPAVVATAERLGSAPDLCMLLFDEATLAARSGDTATALERVRAACRVRTHITSDQDGEILHTPARFSLKHALIWLWGPGYWVTWHPSSRQALGTYGTVRKRTVVPVGDLPDQDIEPTTVDPRTEDGLVWYTKGAVHVRHGVRAQAGLPVANLADAQGRMQVTFTSKNAVLVVYQGLSEHRLASQPKVAEQLLNRYLAGAWQLDWCVISHLVTAQSGTVLMARDKDAAIEFAAKAAAGAGPAGLADLATKAHSTYSSELACELVGATVTPFYRVLRLRRRFVRGVEAAYGYMPGLRTSSDRPAQIPPEILEEVQDTPEAALEFVPQPQPDPDPDPAGEWST